MFNKLEKFKNGSIWNGFYKVNGFIISIVGVGLTLMEFATVFFRYVLKKDIFGGEEIILLLAWWLYFLGSIGGSQEDTQIKADMIDVFCRNKFIVDMSKGIAKALECAIFIFCTYLTGLMLSTNFVKMPVTTGLKIPYVASQIPIIIGFIFMAAFAFFWSLYFIARALDSKGGKK